MVRWKTVKSSVWEASNQLHGGGILGMIEPAAADGNFRAAIVSTTSSWLA